MADDDRLLRGLYAESAAEPRTHPDDATWEAFALGELDGASREAVLDHVVRCAECATIHRGLKMLAAGAAEFDPAVPRAAGRPARVASKPWIYGALAAAAAAVFAVWLPLQPRGPAVPSPEPSDDVRSPDKAAPVPLAPTGLLTAAPADFRWQPIAEAVRYRVELSNEQGDLLWASPPVQGSTVSWPSTVRGAPGVYHWVVIGLPDVSRPLSTAVPSRPASFEIAAP